MIFSKSWFRACHQKYLLVTHHIITACGYHITDGALRSTTRPPVWFSQMVALVMIALGFCLSLSYRADFLSLRSVPEWQQLEIIRGACADSESIARPGLAIRYINSSSQSSWQLIVFCLFLYYPGFWLGLVITPAFVWPENPWVPWKTYLWFFSTHSG